MARIPRPILALLAAAALAVAAFVAWRAAAPAVDAYAVERADLVQTVVASGRLESPRRVEVASTLTGTVIDVPVREGQAVEEGQLLVALDAREVEAAADQARHAVDQARARIAQLRATTQPIATESLRQAEANHANAQRNLERSQELFARGFIGRAALDEAQRARDVAESQWKSARLQQESAAPGGTDDRLAEAALAQAEATLRAARAKLAFTTVEAPVAGTLIARSVERGNVVQPGKTLMVLSPAGPTQVVVQIDEKNLRLVRVGQPALASADAYPDQRFAARVAYVNPSVDPSRGSVEVKLDVADPPAYLLQDMTVSVDIEVERRTGVLMVPADAVHGLATSAPWVMAVREGRAARQPVKLGAKGEGRVEVAQGLAEGELVLPAAASTPAREGNALRAKAQPRPVAERR